MKVLSKLIALCCAVCMVGMVWGKNYSMYVFKDKNNAWNIIMAKTTIEGYGNYNFFIESLQTIAGEDPSKVPGNWITGFSKELDNITIYHIENPNDTFKQYSFKTDITQENLEKFEKEQNITINTSDPKLLFEEDQNTKKTLLQSIQDALKTYDKKQLDEKYKQGFEKFPIKELEEKVKTETDPEHQKILQELIKEKTAQESENIKHEKEKQEKLDTLKESLAGISQEDLDKIGAELKKGINNKLARNADYWQETYDLYEKEVEKRKQTKTPESSPDKPAKETGKTSDDPALYPLAKALRDLSL